MTCALYTSQYRNETSTCKQLLTTRKNKSALSKIELDYIETPVTN